MIEDGANLQYVYWAYAGVAVAVVLLVGWIVLESRRVKSQLNALERQGIRRAATGLSA